ncbi:uncharacterized protein LOC113228775 isoform X1 [Hyposmocoma kahamanoa]|uniref:uncharacterized protein LOC113228775 isoform X1 n=1 Tax=Hyposmocoma kahamanoa TaxID=1477025 RepID=UPI000E6D7527|nr:uncharacterized protein LOC113228775 isoform X1 [Hyposmocoma kahamanoa]
MVLRINASQVFVCIMLVLSICKSSPVNDRRASRNEVGESHRATIVPKQIRRRPDYNDLVELKNVDLAYGTKLSSLEEPQALKLDIKEDDEEQIDSGANEEASPIQVDRDAPNAPADPTKPRKRKSTRCSTDRSITLGPDFQLSSSAENNDEGNGEDDEVKKGITKLYYGPPMAKTPDHYIDDA